MAIERAMFQSLERPKNVELSLKCERIFLPSMQQQLFWLHRVNLKMHTNKNFILMMIQPNSMFSTYCDPWKSRQLLALWCATKTLSNPQLFHLLIKVMTRVGTKQYVRVREGEHYQDSTILHYESHPQTPPPDGGHNWTHDSGSWTRALQVA